MALKDMKALERSLQRDFKVLRNTHDKIRAKLQSKTDKKLLKGEEVVGWIGEIFGKLLMGGKLVHDKHEHDFVVTKNKRISVKTRKGKAWKRSGAIPKITGVNSPTHLMFVRLGDDYSVNSIWLYPWKDLLKAGRFKVHQVRGSKRSWVINVNEKKDRRYLKYSK